MSDAVDGAHAVVISGSVRHTVRPGDSLTFGRGQGHDLRIGHTPLDRRIPRYAGRLECREDGVLIQNVSDKRTITAETFPGPAYEILPLMMVGTAPHDLVSLVIRGETGSRYAITIDTSALRPSTGQEPPARRWDDSDVPTTGYYRIDAITQHQRTLLCALCLPETYGWGGRKVTPTYNEMERILRERGFATGAKTIRNVLDDLRRKLAVEYGVLGVHSEGPLDGETPPPSYLPALARWARLSSNVSDEELEDFDARDIRA